MFGEGDVTKKFIHPFPNIKYFSNKKKSALKFVCSFIVLFIVSATVHAQVIDLRGDWKFNVGDKAQWASPDFEDSKWGSIYAPSTWEDEGFNGYDGFAWYRKKFDGKKLDKNEAYYLILGYIDDTDEVYVNGKLVGFSGSMPPKFKTAYNNERRYSLPEEVINFKGENTIAIRVFDTTIDGGIIDGTLGIFQGVKNKILLVDLEGIWSFATSAHGKPIKSEEEWIKLMVPGPWEHQGYPRYDGFAWYKRTFTLPANYKGDELLLLLGRIDDFDKAYLNGVLIGSTKDKMQFGRSNSYLQNRAYPISTIVLNKKGINTIEIVVEDIGNLGGMYEGTVGIITKTNYAKYFGTINK